MSKLDKLSRAADLLRLSSEAVNLRTEAIRWTRSTRITRTPWHRLAKAALAYAKRAAEVSR